jgi:threonine/homoserine/homoserine lactone efflux protein
MITTEFLIAIVSFAFVVSVTPGPNNVMLTASGANFGFVRTLPHIAGIVSGIAVMNLFIGLGLGAIFQQFQVIQQILKLAGSLYLIWLALKLLKFSHVDDSGKDNRKPFSFIQALVFQFVNPKAWIMVLSANASFSHTGEFYWFSVLIIIGLFALIGSPSIMIWAFFGQIIKRFLSTPAFLKIFNLTMASLTAACILFIWNA